MPDSSIRYHSQYLKQKTQPPSDEVQVPEKGRGADVRIHVPKSPGVLYVLRSSFKLQKISGALWETPILFLFLDFLIELLEVSPKNEDHDDGQPVDSHTNQI